ncbi:MAG: hypothetical protein D6729_10650 [Deltaproteobacteria bacterium]|nr:MAG: hypothetical protein D6729_10650 [Deltaproteobacteria bacterium]
MKPSIRPLAALLVGVAVPAICLASTVLALSIEEMARRSDLVLRGRVEGQTTERIDGRLYTLSTVKVEAVWKGAARDGVVVRQLGGRDGELATRVAGDAVLEPGEEVVLFLRRNPQGAPVYHLVGLAQAKFRVERRGGRLVARRDLGGLLLLDPAAGQALPAGKARAPEAFDLDVLRRRVEGVK